MIIQLFKPGQHLDSSSNHVVNYQLLTKSDEFEVIKMSIKADSLIIVQKEECHNNQNFYFVHKGLLKHLYSYETFGPGSTFFFKDLNETILFEVLEDVELIWTVSRAVYHELVNENDIISITLDMIQEKDHYTKEHSLNVSKLAKKLGVKMKLPGREVSNLAIAAISHDLGKVDIPIEILNKPSKLTKEEYSIIKEHVDFSVMKLSTFLPDDIIQIVEQHHERLDGSGYPKALKESEICLGAKILAVVDSYDAMLSVRPYKSSRGKKESLEVLKECKGTLYDDAVVDAFIEMMQDN